MRRRRWSRHGPAHFWWIEAEVDQTGDRFELRHGSDASPLAAMVGPPQGRLFPVRIFACDEQILAEVRDELDHYLIEVGGPRAWEYMRYHCGTLSNAYSAVHWTYRAATESRLHAEAASANSG